ncbi:hypothetical protein [Enorma sp.]|uniref:hypothetical protein n=1 Tax=Enorma sp. TaxID=1920692 RepID=UPI0025BA2879|nr:hypothetical protein [Enorma sp.]
MSPAEYSKRYGKNSGSVSKLLKAGRVRGARKTGNTWEIPEDALIEYAVRKKKNRNLGDIIWDIVEALSHFQYFDAEVLMVSQAQLENAIEVAVSQGFIEESSMPNNGITSCGYKLTTVGVEACEHKKLAFLKQFAEIMGSYSGAAARAFIEES